MILLAISVWHSGCSWDDLDLPSDDGDSPAVVSIAVTPAALELGGVGDSAQMSAAAYD